VVHQVLDHLAKPLAIAADARQRAAHLRPHPHLVLGEIGRRGDVARQLRQVDVAKRESERSCFEARRVQDVSDEVREP
jgi:hypothetical protein